MADKISVREFEEGRDTEAVEEMERRCQVEPSGKTSIFTDDMGDPMCRVRQSPAYLMLIRSVSEYGEEKEIVGVIRGSIKMVTIGRKQASTEVPIYVKVAYILGLRVSPSHRRLGIGAKLVRKMEEWCNQQGAEYSYIATERSNVPSLNLFKLKCNYFKFRTPTVLVHPVHAHRIPIGRGKSIVRLPPPLAEAIYRQLFSSSEFFPADIDAVLANKLHLGTFMAFSQSWLPRWEPHAGRLPPSFALLSVWNNMAVSKLQVKGGSALTYAWCAGTRALDSCMPFMEIPSVPNFFRPFGVYLLYGLHMQGKGGEKLMRGLCRFVHNMAREDDGCRALVAEVGSLDPVKEGVPHWRRFSWAEDIWCMKRLSGGEDDDDDWVRSRPASCVVFVNPRDF